MKKTFFALALSALMAGAGAQTVTVADVEALPGETVAFSLNLSGGKADTYIAMQFDVQFPATGFTTTGDYSVSPLWKNATSVIGTVDVNGVATIPVSSSETIDEADVENLLTVSFNVGSDVALGEYDVTLTNLWLGYGTSSKDYPEDVTFKVKVVSAHTIVLDENTTTIPEAASAVNVRVIRTIAAGNWSTICLPFAMTESQMKSAFGNDVQLADFSDYEFDADADVITVSFTDASEIEANHPYIIKVNQDISEFTVEGVDINPDEDGACIENDNGKTGNRRVVYSGFYGTYHAETEVPEFCLFLNSNKFWYSVGNTKMKAFRAYFEFLDVLSSVENEYAGSHLVINFAEEETGITEVTDSSNNAVSYDLFGRRVENNARGLYIRNAQKVMIK